MSPADTGPHSVSYRDRQGILVVRRHCPQYRFSYCPFISPSNSLIGLKSPVPFESEISPRGVSRREICLRPCPKVGGRKAYPAFLWKSVDPYPSASCRVKLYERYPIFPYRWIFKFSIWRSVPGYFVGAGLCPGPLPRKALLNGRAQRPAPAKSQRHKGELGVFKRRPGRQCRRDSQGLGIFSENVPAPLVFSGRGDYNDCVIVYSNHTRRRNRAAFRPTGGTPGLLSSKEDSKDV